MSDSVNASIRLPHKAPVFAGVCVSLDVLLDTRLGTVLKIAGVDVSDRVLKGNYYFREDDDFPGVNLAAYKAAYKARDVETLALSTLTNVVEVLRDILVTLMKQAVVRPFHEGVCLTINTYPYQLTEEETREVLKMMAIKFQALTNLDVPIRFDAVHLSEAELTPEYCTAHFSAMFMYDYEQWLAAQQHAIIKRPIPEVTLYAPALYFAQTPSEETLAELKTQYNWSPFETMERSVRGGILLQLLPPAVFSVIKP